MPTFGPSFLPPPRIHFTQRCYKAKKTQGSFHRSPSHYNSNLIYSATKALILKHCCTIIHFKRKPKFRNMLIKGSVCVQSYPPRLLQWGDVGGRGEEVWGGEEEIGSDSSAERCKVLQWLANLPGLGRLVFSVPSWRKAKALLGSPFKAPGPQPQGETQTHRLAVREGGVD